MARAGTAQKTNHVAKGIKHFEFLLNLVKLCIGLWGLIFDYLFEKVMPIDNSGPGPAKAVGDDAAKG